MSIDITTLDKSDIGKWVKYKTLTKSESGRIKSWNDKFIFVVYQCGSDWSNLRNYTAVATPPEDLSFIDDIKKEYDFYETTKRHRERRSQGSRTM
jgi:hypothetical protein